MPLRGRSAEAPYEGGEGEMHLTRRHFASLLGLLAAGGGSVVATAAEDSSERLRRQHGSGSKDALADKLRARSQAEEQPLTAPDEIWADLIEGNRRFMAGRPRVHELVHRRQELAKGQHPQVIILGCADSRVPPELVFDRSLGELFVVRAAGNIADSIALGSLEYAVEHLHAKVLVVLGHEQCGAVAAAASGEKMPTLNLEAIVQKILPALEPLKTRANGEQLVRLGIEANVQRSAKDILDHSPILQQEVDAGKLALIKALYRLESGEVVRLG
jgi:carbonic anhydrase